MISKYNLYVSLILSKNQFLYIINTEALSLGWCVYFK